MGWARFIWVMNTFIVCHEGCERAQENHYGLGPIYLGDGHIYCVPCDGTDDLEHYSSPNNNDDA